MAINVIAIIYDISFKKSLPESLYNCYKCKDKSFKMKTSRLTPDLQNQVVQLVLVALSTFKMKTSRFNPDLKNQFVHLVLVVLPPFKMKTSRFTPDLQNQVVHFVLVVLSTGRKYQATFQHS